MRIQVVRWRPPLGESVNPYINKIAAVRRLEYGRLQAALNLVQARTHQRVLELGCWAGYFLPSLLKYFPEVWGVDDDSASVVERVSGKSTILQIAAKLCEAEGSISNLRLAKATGSALPFPDRYFDLIFCMDTLAHVPTQLHDDVVNELRRVTNRDGQLIFSLPVETGPMLQLKKGLRRLTGKEIDSGTTHYDFRKDLVLLRSAFSSCHVRFFPLNVMGELNPFVLITCRTARE